MMMVLAAALAVGCGDDGGDTDGGATADGGADATDSGTDSGTVDPDAGAPEDGGGSEDGGTPGDDAGTMMGARTIPAPFDEGVEYATTLHVAMGGRSDATGTMEDPFDTIRNAAGAASPGTRILVAAGTYGPVTVTNLAGTVAAPIAIVADGEVIIEAGDGNGWASTDLEYVVIQGFTIRGAGVHGMNIDDGGSYETPTHHLVLRDMTIPSAGSGGNNDCIKMSGVDDFWVLGSDVRECNRGEIIDMVGCHDGVIAGNHFESPVNNGVQAKGGSADILITGNDFIDIPQRAVNAGGSTGLDYFRPIDAPHEAARIRVIANQIIRPGGGAIAFTGCDACVFAHNTVIEPGHWAMRILQENTDARFVPSRDGRVMNNLFVVNDDDVGTYVNVGPDTAPETFVFEANLWWALDRDAGWGGPNYGITPPELDLIQMDPMLTDLAGGDYRPMAGSPLIGAARDTGLALPPDHRGRCYGDPATIGAHAAP